MRAINSLFLLIKKIANKILIELYSVIIKCFYNICENNIIFESKPDYSDNPLALSEFLIKNGYNNQYKIFWLVTDENEMKKKHPDDNVTFFQLKNKFGIIRWSSFKVVATVKYHFVSHNFTVPKRQSLSEKRHILLWHGCGYKKSGGHIKRFFDLALVPGPLFIKTKAQFWNTSEQYICATGYPRYDWMLSPTNHTFEFKKKYAQNHEKLVIWMPTFRNSKFGMNYPENKISNFPLLSSQDDWDNIETFCKEKNIVLLVKLHIQQKEYKIDFSRFQNIKRISNEDFERNKVQLYEFLALTDGLISDYSSVAVDYLLVDKPIGFALDDYEAYKECRGFVFENPLDYMPGHHMYSINDLKIFLSDIGIGQDTYKVQREKVKKVALVQETNYSKAIVDLLDLEKAKIELNH